MSGVYETRIERSELIELSSCKELVFCEDMPGHTEDLGVLEAYKYPEDWSKGGRYDPPSLHQPAFDLGQVTETSFPGASSRNFAQEDLGRPDVTTWPT
jgi:hypothetical protein